MLAAAAIIYGAEFNPLVSLKAISYHDDPSLADLPECSTRAYSSRAAHESVQTAHAERREKTRDETMRPLPCTPDLLSVAPHVIWFPPEQALANPIRLAHVMTYATPEESPSCGAM